jgi:hypothetical protein
MNIQSGPKIVCLYIETKSLLTNKAIKSLYFQISYKRTSRIPFFGEITSRSNTWYGTAGGNTLLLGNTGTSTITTTGTYTGNVSFTSGVISTSNSAYNVKSVETGRVAEGGKSNQEFSTTSGNFSDWAWNTYEFHLLPESLKAIEASDIRNYCGECGVRIRKSSWKFCPNCGEAL